MQLPDEDISYQYQSALVPAIEDWSPAAELRTQHFLQPARLKDLMPRLLQVRSQVAAERELQQIPAELQPLDAGFIDLPQRTLDEHRRKGDQSLLSMVQAQATQLREQVDHVVVLGAGNTYFSSRALFDALRRTHHNQLPPEARMGSPRIYFAGNDADNDSLQELIELLQASCVDPELREERWGMLVISKADDVLETAATYRILRREASEFYGARSDRLRQLVVPVTAANSGVRDFWRAEGFRDEQILTTPPNVGERYSVLTAAGILPAAVMGLDVRGFLLGAAAMTKRFLEEPFERNPILQYAGFNYLMSQELGKPIRMLSVWSRKLEALGWWYDQLVAGSLGKNGRGPTPVTTVGTRDLPARSQQNHEGSRNKLINNLVLKSGHSLPVAIGMAEQNADDLNALSRKTLPDVALASWESSNLALYEAARPTADLILPSISEHILGQLMQMLMLATVIEGRLMGINPYGQHISETYKRHLMQTLKKSAPDLIIDGSGKDGGRRPRRQ